MKGLAPAQFVKHLFSDLPSDLQQIKQKNIIVDGEVCIPLLATNSTIKSPQSFYVQWKIIPKNVTHFSVPLNQIDSQQSILGFLIISL